MYFIKFNKETGLINGLTNVTPNGDNFVTVDEETYVKFVEDSSLRNSHIVKFDVSTKSYVLQPYQQPKINYDIRDIIHHVPYNLNADCLITKHKDKWTVDVANTDILLAPNQVCKFSVTKRKDIHMLIRTFTATIDEIMNTLEVSFVDDEETGNVSIYTPMVFNSYGLIDDTI